MWSLPVALAVVAALAGAASPTAPPVVSNSTPSIPPVDQPSLVDPPDSQERQLATLLEAAQDLLKETRALLQEERLLHQDKRALLCCCDPCANNTPTEPRHCKDYLDAGDTESGVRVIYPYPEEPNRPLSVYCDQTTGSGGWTVFQRRVNTSVREEFYRTFQEYAEGFGNLEQEFWLGLDALYALTFNVTQTQELRIDLADWEGDHRYALYDHFRVAGPTDNYRLTAGGYSGNAGDSFADYHSGQEFSTFDSDNDASSPTHCAELNHGAWWYNSCCYSNLNGYPYEGHYGGYGTIGWNDWHGGGYSLRRTAMMLRPASD